MHFPVVDTPEALLAKAVVKAKGGTGSTTVAGESETAMMASNHKSARSRISSPAHMSSSPSSHNRVPGSDGQRSFMRSWLEPPVQNKASFQEAGLMRGGVVENMAPLGTLPKAAKRSPAGGEASAPSAVKRIVLKKSSAATNAAANATATPTPPPPAPAIATTPAHATPPESIPVSTVETPEMEDTAAAMALSPLSHPMLPVPVVDVDDGHDEDYVPKKSKTRRHSSHHHHHHHNHHHHNTTTTNSATTTPNTRHSIRRKSARPSPPPIHSSSFTAPPSTLAREPDDKDLADKVVERAVEEALNHRRYPTAWALRLLYDENQSNLHFVSMIEDIYYQRADIDTLQEFNRLVIEKKKEGRIDNKGYDYFEPPSTDKSATPLKAKPAPYGDLIRMDLTPVKTDHRDHRDRDVDDHASKKVNKHHDVASQVGKKVNEHHDVASQVGKKVLPDTEGPVSKKVHRDEDGHVSKKVKIEGSHRPLPSRDANLTPTTNGARPHRRATSNKSPHKSPHKSPRGKKTRSGSVSSTSSLSSVPDDVPEDYEEYMDQVDDDLGVVPPGPLDAESNKAQIPAGPAQPISATKKKPTAKKKNVSPHPAAPSQNTPQHHPSRDSSMPVATVANGASHPPTHQPSSAIKFNSRFGQLDDSDIFAQKKISKKAETGTTTQRASSYSSVRDPHPLEEFEEEDTSFLLPLAPPPPEQHRLSRTPAVSSRAARAAKRNQDELDESISPTTSSFRADLEPSSTRNSRAATPSNLRSAKKPRAGLRVKNSPMKKKGTSAGVPRANGERPSPVGNGAPNNQDDNDDSCYACGGNGELVCCDGCNYSFHFLCIDPPMGAGHVPDEWYCNECTQRYFPPHRDQSAGAFGPLNANLERKNPRAFRLPLDVRDCFEGVKTGQEGEYEEIVIAKPKTNKKALDEPFDFYRIKNADGPVLCHLCHKGSADNRPIVPCSACGLNWHLDCLDPPLAVPQVPRTWRCPLHMDEMLSGLSTRLAPAHKYRKVKNAPVIEQTYSRGMANNGWIEIEDDDDEEELADAWRERMSFGRVHRVSAKGIKLDFIDRVRQNRQNRVQTSAAAGAAGAANPAFAVASSAPSLEEQQAALNLSQLARGDGDGTQQLVQAMLSQANPNIISMMAVGDAQRIATGNLSNADVTSLQAMLTQAESFKQGIAKILDGRNASSIPHGTTGAGPSTGSTTGLTRGMTGSLELTSSDDLAVVDDNKADVAGAQNVNGDVKLQKSKSTTDDSAMRLD